MLASRDKAKVRALVCMYILFEAICLYPDSKTGFLKYYRARLDWFNRKVYKLAEALKLNNLDREITVGLLEKFWMEYSPEFVENFENNADFDDSRVINIILSYQLESYDA